MDSPYSSIAFFLFRKFHEGPVVFSAYLVDVNGLGGTKGNYIENRERSVSCSSK